MGLIVLMSGAALLMAGTAINAQINGRDVDLLWRESSGPRGERNRSALPLYRAVFAHDQKRVETLLDQGVNPNLLLYSGRWSPLMVAIAYNDLSTVQVLIKRGADMNYVSNDPVYGTPLAVALSYGRFYTIDNPDFAMLHYLLDAGADINIEYHNGDIAQDAVTKGRMDIVNELLTRGFHHDLPSLKKWLEIRAADEKSQAQKEKAIATINRLLER